VNSIGLPESFDCANDINADFAKDASQSAKNIGRTFVGSFVNFLKRKISTSKPAVIKLSKIFPIPRLRGGKDTFLVV